MKFYKFKNEIFSLEDILFICISAGYREEEYCLRIEYKDGNKISTHCCAEAECLRAMQEIYEILNNKGEG